MDKVLEHEEGILCAGTAFGKTVAAAYLMAARKTNTLVLVHRAQLSINGVSGWPRFLDLPINRIGQISGGKSKRTGEIDVALLQSLHRKGETKDLVAEYGHIVVDECHHLSAVTFEHVMRQVKSRYVLGFDGYADSEGWPPPDHLYAMWSKPIQPTGPVSGRGQPVRTSRKTASDEGHMDP